jgi:hypothetical protein
MNREEVISLMNDVVNHLNRQVGQSQNLSDLEIDQAIENHQEALTHINGLLYDELYNRRVIA